jgi:hypothetical protein
MSARWRSACITIRHHSARHGISMLGRVRAHRDRRELVGYLFGGVDRAEQLDRAGR